GWCVKEEGGAAWAGRVCLLDCGHPLCNVLEGDYGAGYGTAEAHSAHRDNRRAIGIGGGCEFARPGERASGIADGTAWSGARADPGACPRGRRNRTYPHRKVRAGRTCEQLAAAVWIASGRPEYSRHARTREIAELP